MNLAEALDVLPELTTVTKIKRIFRVDPRLVGREHVEEGQRIYLCHLPGSSSLFRLTPEQWRLVHLFDGQRSYQEISDLFLAETGIQLEADDTKTFAEMMEESNFWYQTPHEKNIALMQKLRARRKKEKKARAGDLAHITVAHFDADTLVEKAHRYLRFVFTPWFTALTLAFFAFMTYVFIAHWSEIGSDSLQYYTFTTKSAADLAEFWILFLIMAFFHESAHAICCKHYGGGVHATGFHLIYLTPAFFVDVTEAWVYTNRIQRLVTMLAGIWTELIVCSAATVVWWGTPPGGPIHDLAYKVMLITGVAVVLMNLNPLIKLDGYYIMSEALGIEEIKERSTSLVTGWVQRHILRLPVEVPYVRPLRRWFFVPYAIISGIYSYLLLYTVARFAGNVFRHYSPEWAFIPTLLLAFLIFKSRLLKLGKTMQTVYEAKGKSIPRQLTPVWTAILALIVVLLLFVPYLQDTVEARFILEPTQRAVVRSEVPGTVVEVLVHEGQDIDRDTTLLRLRNLDLESQKARIQADVELAHFRDTQVQIQNSRTVGTEKELMRDQEKSELLAQQLRQLELRSPIAGRVVSPRPADLLGSHLAAGATAMEIADLSSVRARLYVMESEIRDIRVGQTTKLRPDSAFRSIAGVVGQIASASSESEFGLEPQSKYKGLTPPRYYAVMVEESNTEGKLMEGMIGTAKIYTVRRSFATRAWRIADDFVRRKLW